MMRSIPITLTNPLAIPSAAMLELEVLNNTGRVLEAREMLMPGGEYFDLVSLTINGAEQLGAGPLPCAVLDPGRARAFYVQLDPIQPGAVVKARVGNRTPRELYAQLVIVAESEEPHASAPSVSPGSGAPVAAGADAGPVGGQPPNGGAHIAGGAAEPRQGVGSGPFVQRAEGDAVGVLGASGGPGGDVAGPLGAPVGAGSPPNGA